MARYGNNKNPGGGRQPAPSPTPQPAPKPAPQPGESLWTVPPTRVGQHGKLWLFDSIQAARPLLDTVPAHRAGIESEGTYQPHWHGDDGDTYAKVEHLATHGWLSGVAKAAKLADAVREHLPDVTRPRQAWDVAPGQYFDVSRICEGDPECWASPTPQRDRPVKILCNLSASSFVGAASMLHRGAALTALVMALQDRGESVELWVGEAITQGGDKREFLLRVQEAGTPTTLDSLAYWTGHPCALRRHMFRFTEHLFPAASLRAYGTPADFETATEAIDFDQVINFDGGNQEWETEAGAVKWVTAQLGKLCAKSGEYTAADLNLA